MEIYKAVKVYFLEKHSKIFAETDQNWQQYKKNEDYIAKWYETGGTKQHNGTLWCQIMLVITSKFQWIRLITQEMWVFFG